MQIAVLLVIGKIFEADHCDEQNAFRSAVYAKMAVRRAYYHVAERGLREWWTTRTCPTTSTRFLTAT